MKVRPFGTAQWVGLFAVLLLLASLSPIGVVDIADSGRADDPNLELRVSLFVADLLPLSAAAIMGIRSMFERDELKANRWGWWTTGLLVLSFVGRLVTNQIWKTFS